MEKTPENALEAGIAIWVEDNQDIVRCAMRLGTETTSLGLVDTEQNSFMQIIPTDVFGSNGNLIHECFLNINLINIKENYCFLNMDNAVKEDVRNRSCAC